MADCLLVHKLGALRPTDAMGEELLASIRSGEIVRVKITRARVPKHHRRFMALVSLIAKNSSFTTAQVLHLFKLATGHFDEVKTRRGVERIPRSIAWAKMDEQAFTEFERACIEYTITEILPGLPPGDLLREIENLCGLNYEAPRARRAA